jgi:hypothetical protein
VFIQVAEHLEETGEGFTNIKSDLLGESEIPWINPEAEGLTSSPFNLNLSDISL